MKIGINWGCYGKLDIKKQARLIADNGFDSTFLAGKIPEIKEIIDALKEHNIECENVHAPFDHIADMWKEGESGDRMLEDLMETVETCANFEIPTMIVHPSGRIAPRISEIGYERFYRLMEYAKQNGVTVAYENIRILSNLAVIMEEFPEAKFCWDVGHEGCFTPGRQYMPLFGARLGALHIQDNEMEYDVDLHLIPYDGKMDFERVARQLADSEYHGSLMLEVLRKCSHYYDTWSPEKYFSHAAKAAIKLRDAVENYRG